MSKTFGTSCFPQSSQLASISSSHQTSSGPPRTDPSSFFLDKPSFDSSVGEQINILLLPFNSEYPSLVESSASSYLRTVKVLETFHLHSTFERLLTLWYLLQESRCFPPLLCPVSWWAIIWLELFEINYLLIGHIEVNLVLRILDFVFLVKMVYFIA